MELQMFPVPEVLVRRLTILAVSTCVAVAMGATIEAAAAAPAGGPPGQRILPPGAIQKVMVIDVENEGVNDTFLHAGTYIHDTLLPQGELLQNYYATGHVSLDNYIAQVSGQSSNFKTNSDCIGAGGNGSYTDVLPGVATSYPGQVIGQGCVYPGSVQTIGDQLDSANPQKNHLSWRMYAEDMGDDPARDGGTADPLGGTTCAHPVSSAAADLTNNAQGPNATGSQVHSSLVDQYATRHNPFVYFHSVIDDPARCDTHVVPLGTVTVGTNGAPDTFNGHLAQDLSTPATTPDFSFISPNLCTDGHDATCAGTNTEGGTAGGLTAANIWLKHWMPLIMNSPAYRSGHLLVVLTADEGNIIDSRAGDNEQAGPNNANPGYSPVLNVPAIPIGGGITLTYYQYLFGLAHLPLPAGLSPANPAGPPAGTMPGGGQIGALLLNPRYVPVGTINTTGSYNHYSALRTFEDLLGLTTGGADGQGHLGFAATATAFGSDVFVKPGG
jgi:hypothetical protein